MIKENVMPDAMLAESGCSLILACDISIVCWQRALLYLV